MAWVIIPHIGQGSDACIVEPNQTAVLQNFLQRIDHPVIVESSGILICTRSYFLILIPHQFENGIYHAVNTHSPFRSYSKGCLFPDIGILVLGHIQNELCNRRIAHGTSKTS